MENAIGCTIDGPGLLIETEQPVSEIAFRTLMELGVIEHDRNNDLSRIGESGYVHAEWKAAPILESNSLITDQGRAFLTSMLALGDQTPDTLTRPCTTLQRQLLDEMLICYCKLGNSDGIVRSLKLGANPNKIADSKENRENMNGYAALAIAALRGPDALEGVRALIEAGASVNEPSDNGLTPLMAACSGCARKSELDGSELIHLLIDSGASANDKFSNGVSCAFLCINQYDGVVSRSALKALIDRGADMSAHMEYESSGQKISLLSSLAYVDADAAIMAINAGAQLNTVDTPENAPITEAVGSGYVALVRELVRRGVDTDLQIPGRGTLVDIAKKNLEEANKYGNGSRYQEIIDILSNPKADDGI